MSTLREARLKSKLTGPQVSLLTGVSATNLYRYENKNRKLPVPVAKKLAKIYRTKWETFYEEDKDGAAS